MTAQRPLIAIVGSLDPTREDKLGLTHLEHAETACRELGRELAAAGKDLLVYTASPEFIEAAVVAGYIEEGSAAPGSIKVRLPQDAAQRVFPQQHDHAKLFDVKPDASGDWRHSFYRSLQETDGVILMGGGESTYVTGLVALAFSIPIVAIATFGGRARDVWEALHNAESDAEPDEISAMARPWNQEHAALLVASLTAQAQRRTARLLADPNAERRARRRMAVSLLTGVLLLVGCGVAIAVAYSEKPGSTLALLLLLGTPLLAAASGAIMRCGIDETDRWLRAATLGAAAGFIASLLFVVAQFATTPNLLETDEARKLLFFVAAVAFIAGFGFDTVYSRFKETDVVNTKPVAP